MKAYRNSGGDIVEKIGGDVGVYVGGDVSTYVGGDVGGDITTTAAINRAREYAEAATAPATRRAYKSDWECYVAWCEAAGLPSIPAAPQTIAAYLATKAQTLRVATLERRLATIATAHRLAGHQLDTRHPGIRETMRGIKRQHGSAQRQAAPVTCDLVKRMADTCDGSLIGLRDKAMLLLGFAGAFRRSEMVALETADFEETAEGLRITIRHSKTDQAREGQVIGIVRSGSSYCPVGALAAWLSAAGIGEGPVFRNVNRHSQIGEGLSDKTVSLVVKARAEAAGLDPARFSGHSLRSGLATSAASMGIEERHIQRQTRHRSVAVLRRYIRQGELFRDNVTGRVGL